MPQRQSPRRGPTEVQSPKRGQTEVPFQPRRVNNPFRIIRGTDSFEKIDKLIASTPTSPSRKLPPIRFASPNRLYLNNLRPSWERQYFSDRIENPYLHSTLLRESLNDRSWSDPVVAVEDAWNTRPDAFYGEYYQDTSSYRLKLQIVQLDLLCPENAAVHHTSKYDQISQGKLVVRRGQRFDIYVKFNRDLNLNLDKIRLIFETGNQPSIQKGTYVEFYLNQEAKGPWHASIARKLSFDEYVIGITVPPFCLPSGWKLTITNTTIYNAKQKTDVLDKAGPIYIIFNPWCKDDDVYFPDSNLLEEYVENDSGAIFIGNYKQIGAKPWFFGQFEDGILEASLYCLHKSFNFNFGAEMGDPVTVSKALSATISSQDGKGMLAASWTSNHYSGVSPLRWVGSVGILKEFMDTKKPVKFAQCFVFAGVFTTICRSLGIPCRCVTNFSSARNTNGMCKVDVYWDYQNMKKLEAVKDTVWSFHVWNDVWMRRDSDLAPNFSGWQAIDSTPQEQGIDATPLGPTSLVALRNGNCKVKYDTEHFFAEINADRINYSNMGNGGKWQVQYTEREVIGKSISTKIPDGKVCKSDMLDVESMRFDITSQYKYEDESLRERIANLREIRNKYKPNFFTTQGNEDIVFEGFMDTDFIMIGSNFDVSGLLKNNSHRSRTVEGKLLCETVTYTGKRVNVIKNQGFRGLIKPKQECQISMEVEWPDYSTKLTEHASMKISLLMRVIETGQNQAWQDDFRLRKPDLNVEVLTKNIVSGKPIECRFSFQNPLPDTYLRYCTLTLDGPGLREGHKVIEAGDVAPGEVWTAISKISTIKRGTHQLTAVFNSLQIEDISGVATIHVS